MISIMLHHCFLRFLFSLVVYTESALTISKIFERNLLLFDLFLFLVCRILTKILEEKVVLDMTKKNSKISWHFSTSGPSSYFFSVIEYCNYTLTFLSNRQNFWGFRKFGLHNHTFMQFPFKAKTVKANFLWKIHYHIFIGIIINLLIN
jgi:hypothetical protein